MRGVYSWRKAALTHQHAYDDSLRNAQLRKVVRSTKKVWWRKNGSPKESHGVLPNKLPHLSALVMSYRPLFLPKHFSSGKLTSAKAFVFSSNLTRCTSNRRVRFPYMLAWHCATTEFRTIMVKCREILKVKLCFFVPVLHRRVFGNKKSHYTVLHGSVHTTWEVWLFH